MNEIELYDIITLDNNEEYTILKILKKEEEKYYLLAKIDEEEEPNMEEIKIAKEVVENGLLAIEEIEDQALLKELSKDFLASLRENLE